MGKYLQEEYMRHPIATRGIWLVVLATILGLVGACTPASPPPAQGTPIKIGFVTPLSGALSSYGVLQRIAVRLAEEDANAAGGVNGAPLQLVIEDSPFDPKQAVTVVRKLAEQDKVFAIVGPYATAEFEVAAPLSNDLKVAVVSPSAMKVGVATKNRPYAFQMNLRDDIAQPPAIDVYKKLYPNVKKVVLTGDTKDAVAEYMTKEVFPKLLKEKGLEVIDTVPFERGMTDFSAVVTKIKGLNPQGIVVAALMPEAIGLAKELERQAVKAPVLASAHVTGGPIVQLGGTAVEGWVMPGLMDYTNPDPMVQSFVNRFFKAAAADDSVKPKPEHLVTEGTYYDTVMILADIMRKAGVKADTPLQQARDKVRDSLQNLKGYKGVVGAINMAPSGEAERQPQIVLVAEKGKYKVVK